MEPKTTLAFRAIAATPSKWMRPALVTLALSAILVVTGCNRSDDSDHRDSDHHGPGHNGGHRNQALPTGAKF